MLKERKFVIGDIHGHFDEMMEVLNCVGFNFDTDLLISLGDLVDRGPKPIEVIETLMKIKNFIHILGNHDEWCYQFLKNKERPVDWLSQGGVTTYEAYYNKPKLIGRHLSFFEKAKLFYIDEESRLFVHAGFNHRIPFKFQTDDKELLIWDRDLISTAIAYDQLNQPFDEFKEIFVGHTPTQYIKKSTPQKIANLWMLDTGVHICGKLTIMDIETKEYWQSTSKTKKA